LAATPGSARYKILMNTVEERVWAAKDTAKAVNRDWEKWKEV
jgi:hypothetical protein